MQDGWLKTFFYWHWIRLWCEGTNSDKKIICVPWTQMSFSHIISTCPWNTYFSNFFQLLWKIWPDENEKLIFYHLKEDFKYYFKIEWGFIWKLFWGITRLCRSKNRDFRKPFLFSDFLCQYAWSFLKSSNFEVQKSRTSQKNPHNISNGSHF